MGSQKRAPGLPFYLPPTWQGPGSREPPHVPSAASRSQSAQAGVGGSRHRSQGHPSSCPREREGGGQAGKWDWALTKGKALNEDCRGGSSFFPEMNTQCFGAEVRRRQDGKQHFFLPQSQALGSRFWGPGKLRHLPHPTLLSTKVSIPSPSLLCSSAPGWNFLDTLLGELPSSLRSINRRRM